MKILGSCTQTITYRVCVSCSACRVSGPSVRAAIINRGSNLQLQTRNANLNSHSCESKPHSLHSQARDCVRRAGDGKQQVRYGHER
jgi:hypothetical protein